MPLTYKEERKHPDRGEKTPPNHRKLKKLDSNKSYKS